MIEQIKELRKEGNGINAIAKKLHIANYRVRNFLIEANLEIKTPKSKNPGRKKIYKANESFFECIDTQEKAYLLGFMMADGCIDENRNGVKISLQEKDKEILEKILVVLDSNHKIGKTSGQYSKNHKRTNKVTLTITSKKLIADLAELGCISRKTDVLKYPTISSHLNRHFMRGFFDGDGTVYIMQPKYIRFGIISTLEFCQEYLKNLPIQPVNIHKEYRTEKNVYYFTVSQTQQIKDIFEFLYKDSKIHLERKYNKFKDYFLK